MVAVGQKSVSCRGKGVGLALDAESAQPSLQRGAMFAKDFVASAVAADDRSEPAHHLIGRYVAVVRRDSAPAAPSGQGKAAAHAEPDEADMRLGEPGVLDEPPPRGEDLIDLRPLAAGNGLEGPHQTDHMRAVAQQVGSNRGVSTLREGVYDLIDVRLSAKNLMDHHDTLLCVGGESSVDWCMRHLAIAWECRVDGADGGRLSHDPLCPRSRRLVYHDTRQCWQRTQQRRGCNWLLPVSRRLFGAGA